MNWKQLVLGTATVTLLAACASTKPQDAASTVNGTANGQNAANANGSSNGLYGADPLHNPNSPLAKRSVYFDFDSSVVKNEYKPTVEAHAAYLVGRKPHLVLLAVRDPFDRATNEAPANQFQQQLRSIKGPSNVEGQGVEVDRLKLFIALGLQYQMQATRHFLLVGGNANVVGQTLDPRLLDCYWQEFNIVCRTELAGRYLPW